jgi:hypothetical protein
VFPVRYELGVYSIRYLDELRAGFKGLKSSLSPLVFNELLGNWLQWGLRVGLVGGWRAATPGISQLGTSDPVLHFALEKVFRYT